MQLHLGNIGCERKAELSITYITLSIPRVIKESPEYYRSDNSRANTH